ncbi:hypothetical protein [Kiloniella sp. b19]|uniref:hypothetical protein n=1 Tax=Kiloniella sp. GXU_MW_B19 TaxID=3141326 RepID=UPI0031E255CB
MHLEYIDVTGIPADHPVHLFQDSYSNLLCKNGTGWSEFDPLMVPRVLPYISVIECAGSSVRDYRQILMGEMIKLLCGGNKTGLKLSEAFAPEALEQTIKAISTAIKDHTPIYSKTSPPYAGREHVLAYRGFFPFLGAADGSHPEVSHIVLVAAETDTLV